MNVFEVYDVANEICILDLAWNIKDVARDLVTIDSKLSYDEIALKASTIAGGKWFSTRNGVYWNITGSSGWIMKTIDYGQIYRARDICKGLTGEVGGWTMGQNAKRMIKWAVGVSVAQKNALKIMDNAEYGYHECKPGIYSNAQYLDMSGCYWQIVRRLGTPRFEVLSSGEIQECPLRSEERVKWDAMAEAVCELKPLRNAVWGSMLGSSKCKPFYHKGERRFGPPLPGTHQTAGIIVARLAHDLTWAAANETHCVYAQTDGIICDEYDYCPTWESAGMRYIQKDAGIADIQGQHRYRIGNTQTEYYRKNALDLLPQAPGPLPDMSLVYRFLY